MDLSAREFANATATAAAGELDNAVKRIIHCLNQLSDEQIWWRPFPSMNSIGNLILHLRGNVRQWIISGVGGAEDTRDRPREFSERGPIAKGELIGALESTIAGAKQVLSDAASTDLLADRRIQGFDVTGIAAIFHSVAHFQGHVQEIVHLTRCELGDDYRFEFVPTTPEQGAP